MGFTFYLCVRLPLVVPPSKPFAVVFRTLHGTEVNTIVGTFLTVAKLQSASGALTKLPAMGWSGTHILLLETLHCNRDLLLPSNWAWRDVTDNIKLLTGAKSFTK